MSGPTFTVPIVVKPIKKCKKPDTINFSHERDARFLLYRREILQTEINLYGEKIEVPKHSKYSKDSFNIPGRDYIAWYRLKRHMTLCDVWNFKHVDCLYCTERPARYRKDLYTFPHNNQRSRLDETPKACYVESGQHLIKQKQKNSSSYIIV